MRGVVVFLVAVGLFLAMPALVGSSGSPGLAGSSDLVALAEGDEFAVVAYVTPEMREKCSTCHRVGRVLSYRLDRAEWITVVWIKMRSKQPDMFASYEDAEPMIDFLSDRYSF
jgi:hypothetical protein